jgi:polar amino acid transport system ATP-binding protein
MLSAENLCKRFGGRTLFEGVSLAVAPGQALAVMGESGTGKTTLLRCLNGLERADTGIVRAGTTAVNHQDPPARFRADVLALRQQVGFVFQGWHLFAHRRVLENVMEGPREIRRVPAAEARRQAQALLDRVGIGHRADAWPQELSGGEQQRAAIARALAMRPEALLLDEPTSALDEVWVERLAELLRGLVKDGLALLTVTHDAAFAGKVAQNVLRLVEGRLR